MNKKVLIGVSVLVFILVLGIIGFLVLGNTKETTSSKIQNTQEQSTVAEKAPNIAEMFANAMTGNTSLKCTFSGSNATGTSYVKQGKVRLDSISSNDKMAHVIFKDKIVWSWNEGETTGIMMDTSTMQPNVTGEPAQVTKPEDIQKQIEENQPQCSQENVDDSMFEAPTNVEFTDYSKMMNDIKSKMPANVTIPANISIPTDN